MGDNAVTSVPVYQAADVLTAANLNITNSGIPVFSGTATRDDAFGGSGEKVLAEGQFAFLEDSNTTQYYDGAAWATVGASKIAQVLSTTKTDTFTSAVTAFTDITGLSVTITPSSATSTILVMADVSTYQDASAASAWARLVRGSTGVYLGDAAGTRTQASHMIGWASGSNTGTPIFMTFVDSPATTSATTYKVQVGNQSGTTYVNRTGSSADGAIYTRTASSITVMEILA